MIAIEQFVFFLAWGSFLNVLAVRLISGKSLLDPSACPACHHKLWWYDNLPVISWFALGGRCRHCHALISLYYPLIELFTLVALTLLFHTFQPPLVYGYFVLFSALIVTFRSDLETMLISRFMSVYLVPFMWVASYFGYIFIPLWESISAGIVAPLVLYGIAHFFFRATGRRGLGQGDIDLMALIGTSTGFIGAWISLGIASLLGSIIGCSYLLVTKKGKNTQIPFGPFLCIGAMIFVLCKPYLLSLVFYTVSFGS